MNTRSRCERVLGKTYDEIRRTRLDVNNSNISYDASVIQHRGNVHLPLGRFMSVEESKRNFKNNL